MPSCLCSASVEIIIKDAAYAFIKWYGLESGRIVREIRARAGERHSEIVDLESAQASIDRPKIRMWRTSK